MHVRNNLHAYTLLYQLLRSRAYDEVRWFFYTHHNRRNPRFYDLHHTGFFTRESD